MASQEDPTQSQEIRLPNGAEITARIYEVVHDPALVYIGAEIMAARVEFKTADFPSRDLEPHLFALRERQIYTILSQYQANDATTKGSFWLFNYNQKGILLYRRLHQPGIFVQIAPEGFTPSDVDVYESMLREDDPFIPYPGMKNLTVEGDNDALVVATALEISALDDDRMYEDIDGVRSAFVQTLGSHRFDIFRSDGQKLQVRLT